MKYIYIYIVRYELSGSMLFIMVLIRTSRDNRSERNLLHGRDFRCILVLSVDINIQINKQAMQEIMP